MTRSKRWRKRFCRSRIHKSIFSLVSFSLFLSLLFSFPASAIDGVGQVSVSVIGNLSQKTSVSMLIKDDSLYLSVEDAAEFSGHLLEIKDSEVVFSRSSRVIGYSLSSSSVLEFKGSVYIELTDVSNSLGMICFSENGILVLFGREHTVEELMEYTDSIFAGELYEVDFLENFAGKTALELSIIWDILGMNGLKYLTGAAAQDIYTEVLVSLMLPEGSEQEYLELATETVGAFDFLSKLQNLYEYSDDNLGQFSGLAGKLIGTDGSYFVHDVLESYDKIDGVVDIERAIDIAGYLYSSKNLSEQYVYMVENTILSNAGKAFDEKITSCADDIILYYREDSINWASVSKQLSRYALSEGEDYLFEMALPLTSLVSDITEKLFDYGMGLSDKFGAVQKTFALRYIQNQAKECYEQSVRRYTVEGDTSSENILCIKYSAMLYIRAAQEAYALYEVGQTMVNKLQDIASEIYKYLDDELIREFDNHHILASDLTTIDSSDTSFPIYLIGKTVGDLREQYGRDFTPQWWAESRVIMVDEFPFMMFVVDTFEWVTENEADKVDGDLKITGIISPIGADPANNVLDNLYDQMTYSELRDAIGDKIDLKEPDVRGNLQFEYKGYKFTYIWSDNQDYNKESLWFSVELVDNPLTAESVEYEITRKEHSVYDETGTYGLKMYYDLFRFTTLPWKFSNANEIFEKLYQAYTAELESEDFDLYAEEAMRNRTLYENFAEAQVFSSGDLLSVLYASSWYMGGVFNLNYSGTVIDLETGKELNIPDLLDEAESSIFDGIRSAVISYATEQGYEMSGVYLGLDQYGSPEDFDFYVEDGKIILLFDTYELAAGYVGPIKVPFKNVANHFMSENIGENSLKENEYEYPVQLIGETVGDCVTHYETAFSADYLNGGVYIQCGSDSPIFILQEGWKPETVTNSARIVSMVCFKDCLLLDGLSSAMTFPEIVAQVQNKISLGEPEQHENLMNNSFEYRIEFVYKGYTFIYIWYGNPDATCSNKVIVR